MFFPARRLLNTTLRSILPVDQHWGCQLPAKVLLTQPSTAAQPQDYYHHFKGEISNNAWRQGHQTLPSRNAVDLALGSKTLFHEHAECGKKWLHHLVKECLTRQVQVGVSWWGDGALWGACFCTHFTELLAVRTLLSAGSCNIFHSFHFESIRNQTVC